MKEQDAAHSFDGKERCKYETWVEVYFGLPDNFPEKATSASFDYGNIVNMLAMFDEKRNDFHKQNLENVMIESDLELTRLRSELQQKDEWISVKDRLPEIGKSVSVYTNNKLFGFATLHFNFDKSSQYWSGYTENGHFICGYEPVTHWMLKPEPPKKQS